MLIGVGGGILCMSHCGGAAALRAWGTPEIMLRLRFLVVSGWCCGGLCNNATTRRASHCCGWWSAAVGENLCSGQTGLDVLFLLLRIVLLADLVHQQVVLASAGD
jgi:hypothetical protein